MSQIDETASPRAALMLHYDTPTLVFHWLTVLFVVTQSGTFLVWNYVTPHNRFWRPILESTHVSLGILFALAILGRIIWQLTGARRLPAEAGLPGILSRAMYIILYALLAAQVVTGFVLQWAGGEGIPFFNLFSIPELIARNRQLEHLVQNLHEWMAWAIVILAAGHAMAALVHHYVLKDATLERMMYRRRSINRPRFAARQPSRRV
ncbi:MAG: cytochrome [Devosia sp.]|uniref:cytochrome b n=1 Tax=Devosia sp. TaxID=1871048 RepID=UPI0026268A5A|nr:cytochrome b [Devosia sp.]MDB5541337.1 cytochrome [Devosia sp.]